MDIDILLQSLEVSEDKELEFKAATDTLPKSLWETVSAFANTDGGSIILGVTETQSGCAAITGVKNSDKLIKDFWNLHNNSQKLNVPICSNADVFSQRYTDKDLILIQIPRANRTQKPIYINNNPKTGTYKRNHEGDYVCSEEELRQMMRDANSHPQDLQTLEGFSLNDLDPEALRAYRQRFRSRDPDHPYLALNDKDLLQKLGGWYQDRGSGREGLTLAGLLMFGRELPLREALPYYHLDYQEKLSTNPEERWTYRLTLDGRWEPNLFNFYYQVYGRLIKDINVPFELDKEGIRRGETHVHEALREALGNCLIHADHLSTRPLTIIKFPDEFEFCNPGRLRIPLKSLYESAGVTDPRNPNLQRMFQMLGLGEKAGTGFPKIFRAWKEQQWWIPLVFEDLDLEMTSVKLPMVSMIPEEIMKVLKEIVGDEYSTLTELDCFALALTHHFGAIRNKDIQQYTKEHPRTIGECLRHLVQKGWLQQSGRSQGTSYALQSCRASDQLSLISISDRSAEDSDHSVENSDHNEAQNRRINSAPLIDYGVQDSDHSVQDSDHSVQDSDHSVQDSDHSAENKTLLEIAEPIRTQGRSNPQQFQNIILQLCSGRYLSLPQLAELLKRKPVTLRTSYISPMLSQGLLELRYPEQLNHPRQAYTSSAGGILTSTDPTGQPKSVQ